MKKEDLYGYLAGAFDADGCISKNPNTGRWYVNVTNTVPAFVERFADVFGGSIHKHRATGETSSSNIVSTKPTYRWYASGMVGMAMCKATLPYLIIKRNKAEQAIKERFGLKNWPPKQHDPIERAERQVSAVLKRYATRERMQRALELHMAGASYRKIMKQLGYRSSAGAYHAVQAAMAKSFAAPRTWRFQRTTLPHGKPAPSSKNNLR